MDLTLDDMQGRPGLAEAVVAYHVVPRIKGKTSDVAGATRAAPLFAASADGAHHLRLFMGANGSVVLEDTQGNTVPLVTAGTDAGDNIVVYGVNRVLMGGALVRCAACHAVLPRQAHTARCPQRRHAGSALHSAGAPTRVCMCMCAPAGSVFFTVSELLAQHPEFRPLAVLFNKTGVYNELRGLANAAYNTQTVFAPTGVRACARACAVHGTRTRRQQTARAMCVC
jgi:hypothetical protein